MGPLANPARESRLSHEQVRQLLQHLVQHFGRARLVDLDASIETIKAALSTSVKGVDVCVFDCFSDYVLVSKGK